MRFVSISLSALFVALFLLFASNLVTSEVYAQEASKTEASSLLQFLVPSQADIKSKPKENSVKQFLPTYALDIAKLPEPREERIMPQSSWKPTVEATLSADLIFNLVNVHRAKIGKSAFEKEAQVCGVALVRSDGIKQEIFITHALHSGFYALNLPYQATENMIWQNSEEGAVNWWLNSPIHRNAIESNYKYACGTCNGHVCNMVFTNYDPKNTSAI